MNIIRVKNITKRWWGQFWYFSPKIAASDFMVSTVLRKSNGRLKHNLNRYYYNKAKDIILNRYYKVVNKWKNYEFDFSTENNIKNNCKVFVFWWQGYSDMPYIVKECIKNIKKYNINNEVIVIDKNTWQKYTYIPNYIIELRQKNVINFTLFSDILRCCLLYENGGIWIDPTCYVTKAFEDNIYNLPFYSIKHGETWEHPICKGYWATFFLACGKENPILGFMRDLFFEYWKREKSFIVYLSLDLFLAIAYEQFDYAKKMIDDVPVNNRNRDKLRNMLLDNGGKDFIYLLNKIDDETYINKLTYKMKIEKIDYGEMFNDI